MTTETSQDRGTHTSASSSAADLLCPGRHLAQRGLPDVQDDSAEYGTSIHDALAKQDPAGLTVDQVETYDACVAIEKKLVESIFPEAVGMNAKPLREQRFWIKWKDDGVTQHSAQLDCAYRLKTKALIIEYKTLTGAVGSSPQNQQLRDQAVLFDHNTPMLGEIYVAVIQPFVTHKPQLSVYKRDDLKRAAAELYQRVLASNNPASPRKPGAEQCKYCRAASAGTCKEHNEWAGKMSVAADDPSNLLDTPCANWTPAQCSLFLLRLPAAQKWLDDCKALIIERLKADSASIPGWELKKGQVRENINNPQAIFDAFSQAGGSLTQFMECISVGKGDLKTALAAVTKEKGKKLDATLSKVIGDNHTFTENEPSIVPVKE